MELNPGSIRGTRRRLPGCGPLAANSLFHHRPNEALKPASKVETAYHNSDRAIQQVLELLAA